MSTWKKYGGLDHYDRSNHITTNSVVADYFTIKKQYIGDFDVCGNIIVRKQIRVDGSAIVQGLLTANTASVYGNLAAGNVDCSNAGTFNNIIVNNDLNISNYNYLHGDTRGIGLNNRKPVSTLDISGNNNTSIHVYADKTINRNILAHNKNHNGIALWSDSNNAYVDFFVDTDISINNTSFDGRIQFDNYGNLLLDANKYVNILPQVVISDISADVVFNESIVTIHGDTSTNLFNYDSYKNKSTFIQNAITSVTKDNSSVMFMNIMKPDKKGFSIAGGVCPYDNNRTLGTIGFTDMSDNKYISNQTIVSGNSTIKYKSTLGINTQKPSVDNYVLDVNGPIRLRNGENNIVAKSRTNINSMRFGGGNKNFGVAVSVLYDNIVPILYTNDAGKVWRSKNLNTNDTLASSGIGNAPVNLTSLYVYDSNYAFTLGGNFNGFYTHNSGRDWQYITFNIPYAPKSLYICNNGANTIRFFITAFTIGSVNDSLFYYDSAINVDSSFGYFNGANYNVLNLSNPIILTNTNNTSVIDGYGNNIYIAGNKGIFKCNINNPTNFTSHIVSDNLGNIFQFNAISVLNNNYVVAVGDRIISFTRDGGTTWTDLIDDFLYFHPQLYNFTSVNIFDSSNAIAVSNDGKIAFTNDGNKWNDTSSSLFNLSGNEKMLEGFLNNVIIIDKNAFILTNTNNTNIDNTSNIVYNFFPDLFNHVNNDVLDVSGNMNLNGNITISPDNTSIIKIESNATNCNFLTGVKDMTIGKSDSTAIFNGKVYIKGLLDAATIKFSSAQLAYMVIDPTTNPGLIFANNVQYALDISGINPLPGTLGGSVRIGDKLDVYGNVTLFGNSRTFQVYGSSTLNTVSMTSCNSNTLSISGNSQFNGTVVITNPSQSMDLNSENGAFYVNGNTKINENLYVMSNMLVFGTNSNYYSLEIRTGNVNLMGALQILNTKLYINNDASFNNNIFVNKNASFNGNVVINSNNANRMIVGSDASFNGNLYIGNSRFSSDGSLFMNKDGIFNNKLFVFGNTTCNNIAINGNTNFNGNVFFGTSVINNTGSVILNNDISFNSNIVINNVNNSSLTINTDTNFNGNIIIGGYSGTKFENDGTFILGKDATFNYNNINLNDCEFIVTNGNLRLSSNDFSNTFFVDTPYCKFSGKVSSNNPITIVSDHRIKEDVQTLKNSSFSLDHINPVYFYNTLSNKNDIGFIAHELQEHYPFLVNGEKDGSEYQSVNYNGLIGLLVHEVQFLKNKVCELENQVYNRK
jgi:cytoskeletal protein CcmA (bactofilin family)